MRHGILVVALAGTATVLVAPALVAQQAVRPPQCTLPEHRQFDFWVGRWRVLDSAGTLVGTNTITLEYNGCVLRESWESARGPHRGGSINMYDRATRRWHQTWMDNGGLLLQLDGELRDGRMVLTGSTVLPAGRRLERITWSREPNGVVRQLWEQSTDERKTWRVSFDGRYHRLGLN